jgi:hypothetical protein
MDHAFQAQSPEVIGHLGAGVRTPEEGFDLRPEVAVAESSGQMGEAGDRLQERHDARVAKAQGRDPLASFDGWGLESVEGILAEDALLADALDFEEFAIDLLPEIAQMGEIGNPFVDVEIVRIVDGRFGA